MPQSDDTGQFKTGDRPSHNVCIVISTDSGDCIPLSIVAQMVDFSPRVAKLTVSESLNRISPIECCVADLQFHFLLDEKECSETQLGENSWEVDCPLSPPVPGHLFTAISDGTPIKRSCNLPFSCNTQTSLSGNLDASTQMTIVQDISTAGFCVWTDDDGKLGKRVHLNVGQIDSTHVVVAKTQWKFNTDIGFLLGCSFLNHRDYERLRELSQF